MDFNPRPRKEGDKYLIGCRKFNSDFNPRPRKEGDLALTNTIIIQGYFNPRPRKEGDDYDKEQRHLSQISIHALVKRATYYVDGQYAAAIISIHALVKRAT